MGGLGIGFPEGTFWWLDLVAPGYTMCSKEEVRDCDPNGRTGVVTPPEGRGGGTNPRPSEFSLTMGTVCGGCWDLEDAPRDCPDREDFSGMGCVCDDREGRAEERAVDE